MNVLCVRSFCTYTYAITSKWPSVAECYACGIPSKTAGSRTCVNNHNNGRTYTEVKNG